MEHLPVLVILLPLCGILLCPLLSWIRASWGKRAVMCGLLGALLCDVMQLALVIRDGEALHYWMGGWMPPFGIEFVIDGVNGAVPAAVELWSRFDDRAVISAESGEGMEELANMVAGIFLDSSLSPETDAVVQNERQYAALKEARQAIDEAREALAVGFSPDVAGISLESALSSLRAIDGRGVCAEVVDGIFAKFCVGK